MPKKNSLIKPVHSYRLSLESVRQIKELASNMGRSEGDTIEIAIDRMYREEIRFGNLIIGESSKPSHNYTTGNKGEEK